MAWKTASKEEGDYEGAILAAEEFNSGRIS